MYSNKDRPYMALYVWGYQPGILALEYTLVFGAMIM